jgi:hypothetical protein
MAQFYSCQKVPVELNSYLDNDSMKFIRKIVEHYAELPTIHATHKVFRYANESEGYVIKLYNNNESKANEITWISEINRNGFRKVPEIVDSFERIVVFKYVDFPELSGPTGLWNTSNSVDVVAKIIFHDFGKVFQRKELIDAHYYKKTANISMGIFNKFTLPYLKSTQATVIESYLERVSQIKMFSLESYICHGSLFTCNILFSEVFKDFCIIDWEKAHIGDKNRDYAAFFFSAWVGDAFQTNIDQNKTIDVFAADTSFNSFLFNYWLIYYALRWSCNPMFTNKAFNFLSTFTLIDE